MRTTMMMPMKAATRSSTGESSNASAAIIKPIGFLLGFSFILKYHTLSGIYADYEDKIEAW